jgi:L-alanine-DL-glutamate epimerase-like enolase superfamily enzyme
MILLTGRWEGVPIHSHSYIADGHTAVKIKLGKEDLEEDIARVAAVREAIGPDVTFMTDANYSWFVHIQWGGMFGAA